MPRLPTVLMTDCIRSSNVGDSHGGAYLVDLEAGTWRKVLDWNDPTINWEGRGSNRGLRGIAFHNGEIYIAASDELFVFDQNFKVTRSFKNRYLGHCHEVFLDGDNLYLASTLYDSILRFNIPSGRFTRAWMLRAAVNTAQPGADPYASPLAAAPRTPQTLVYSPESPNGPKPNDTLHLNQVWVEAGLVYFSGVRYTRLMCLHPERGLKKHCDIPEWTHNARPFRGGVLCNHTKTDAVAHLDLQGNALKSFPVPRYDEASLTNVPAGKDVARQAFARGLVTTPEGLVIGSSSPSTITVYDFDSGKTVKSVNITMDVRNAPHGLAVWPW